MNNINNEQKEILGGVVTWLKHSRESYLTIGGYAGTGKTTVITQLRKLLNKLNPKIRVAHCSYTGKATRVLWHYLRDNGAIFEQDSVSTIHSLIYAPMTDGSGVVVDWRRKPKLEVELIVVDEASMVDELIWRDLLTYRLPIIAVGDHGQLPPIGGQFNLMQTPKLKLETIHRQAKQHPIIALSIWARESGVIPVGNYGQGVRKIDRYDSETGQEVEEMLSRYHEQMLILTGYNQSRINLNKQIRSRQEREGNRPQPGDRLICLRNNWQKGIYNGMTGRLRNISKDTDGYVVEIDFADEGLVYRGLISREQFNRPGVNQEVKVNRRIDLFDYGYALTVHKAQGSQAREVWLFEERNKYMSDDDWRRWLYTGVTRAQERLTVVGRRE